MDQVRLLMTPERWKQVKRILEDALERDPATRAELLDQACKDDQPLRQEVESLIASYEEAGSVLEGPTKVFGDTIQASANRRIGPYKVIREIGHGGMGTVFLGSRADEQYKKLVAIKLIRRGMDTD